MLLDNVTRALFTAIPADERRERLREFAEFVLRRDGIADLGRRTLSRREDMIRRFRDQGILFPGAFDHALFAAQYARYDRARPTPRQMLLLLVLLKINAAEAYSVHNALTMLAKSGKPQEALRVATLLEECYHTQILLSAGRLFGVSVDFRFESFFRIIKALDVTLFHLPNAMSDSLKLASEIYSVMIFTRILGAVHAVTGSDPVLHDALAERVAEVLIDEIGHVSYARLCVGPKGLAAARLLLPIIATALRAPIPEAREIGVLPVPWGDIMSFELQRVPEDVRRRAFVV